MRLSTVAQMEVTLGIVASEIRLLRQGSSGHFTKEKVAWPPLTAMFGPDSMLLLLCHLAVRRCLDWESYDGSEGPLPSVVMEF